MVTTFLATLFLPIAAAVGIGVALSLLLQLNREALDLTVVELAPQPDGQFAERPAPTSLAGHEVTLLDVYGSLLLRRRAHAGHSAAESAGRLGARRRPAPPGQDRPGRHLVQDPHDLRRPARRRGRQAAAERGGAELLAQLRRAEPADAKGMEVHPTDRRHRRVERCGLRGRTRLARGAHERHDQRRRGGVMGVLSGLIDAGGEIAARWPTSSRSCSSASARAARRSPGSGCCSCSQASSPRAASWATPPRHHRRDDHDALGHAALRRGAVRVLGARRHFATRSCCLRRASSSASSSAC